MFSILKRFPFRRFFIEATSLAICSSMLSPFSSSLALLSDSVRSLTLLVGQRSSATWSQPWVDYSKMEPNAFYRLKHVTKLANGLFFLSLHTTYPYAWAIYSCFAPNRSTILDRLNSARGEKETSRGRIFREKKIFTERYLRFRFLDDWFSFSRFVSAIWKEFLQ